jgi:hypothetical protein
MVDEAQSSQIGRSITVSESKRYAVVVGVNDYTKSGANDLSFCAADAEAFYDALLTYCEYSPEHIVLFSDGSHQAAQKPLRSDILAAVSDMCTCATGSDSILFFFAGHGTRDASDSYLLTQEFKATIVSETSIPLETINDYFHKSQARLKMRFFDACHSGRMRVRGLPLSPDIKKHLLVKGEGWATLAACKEEQVAYEDADLGHGIFSYCLVKGLAGEAATPEREVTLYSLLTYTIDKTSEITAKRGLPQTPVADNSQAGNQVLVTLPTHPPQQIAPALTKIQETAVNQLEPTPQKIPQFIADLRSVLQAKAGEQDYIAPSQEKKLAHGDELVRQIFRWCEEQREQYREQLQDLATVTVNRQSIRKCPLNTQLATYIEEKSQIKDAVELDVIYRTETKRVRSGFGITPFFEPYHTREVTDGIKEKSGYYESSVMLTVRARETLLPVCAMVIAVIPATFGLYLLQYSYSTYLGPGREEYWDEDTFAVRILHALSFVDEKNTEVLEDLRDLYPQLLSFSKESWKARKTYLQNIGVSGDSLL